MKRDFPIEVLMYILIRWEIRIRKTFLLSSSLILSNTFIFWIVVGVNLIMDKINDFSKTLLFHFSAFKNSWTICLSIISQNLSNFLDIFRFFIQFKTTLFSQGNSNQLRQLWILIPFLYNFFQYVQIPTNIKEKLI